MLQHSSDPDLRTWIEFRNSHFWTANDADPLWKTELSSPAIPDSWRSVPSPDTTCECDFLDIGETIYLYMLRKWPPKEVAFISLGKEKDDWIKIPPAYLRRFSDLGIEVADVADAQLPRPHSFERVTHKQSGKKGVVYSFKILAWRGDNKVEVSAGFYGGRVFGAGARYVLEKREGRWTITNTRDPWIS